MQTHTPRPLSKELAPHDTAAGFEEELDELELEDEFELEDELDDVDEVEVLVVVDGTVIGVA